MNTSKKQPLSYLDIYISYICPRLKALDLMLKEDAINEEALLEALDVSRESLYKALAGLNISHISRQNIAALMLRLESHICRLLKRELEYGCPYRYNAQAVSYIYNIDKNDVEDAFSFLELNNVTASQLPAIFAQIML